MGKKRSRSTYTSKGQRPNVSNSLLKLVSRETSDAQKELNKVEAWKAGRNPWITIANTDGPTNKRFIKVRANDYFGSYKTASYGIYRGKEQ